MRIPVLPRGARACAFAFASAGYLALLAFVTTNTQAAPRPGLNPADREQQLRDRLTPRNEPIDPERGAALIAAAATEALTGFDNVTNGFSPQGPPFESIDDDNVVPLRSFNDNRFIFEEVEGVADGL